MKRPDIQGIRGLSIAAVLTFHLDDKSFPAGFIGVDMFFVLSGYLMAVILFKEDHLNMTVFRHFYTRRFKRIVPLYAILLFSLAIIVPCFLLPRDVLKFCNDVVWAAAFSTNIQTVLEKRDYFTQLFDSNVLTHTWSLGVEIQYYLIVPLIVFSQRKLLKNCKYFPFTIILLTGKWNCFCREKVPWHFNYFPRQQYRSIPSLRGFGNFSLEDSLMKMDVFQLSENGKCLSLRCMKSTKYHQLDTDENANSDLDYHEKKQTKIFGAAFSNLFADVLSFVLFAFVFSPWIIFPISLLRIFSVILTSGLLVLGCEKHRQGVLLTNRPLVYLGDHSYVVYLAHWPIIVIWKNLADRSTFSANDILICLTNTFVISVLVNKTAEKYFIRTNDKTAAVFVGFLYGLLIMGLMFNVPLEMNKAMEARTFSKTSINITEAIAFNERAARNEYTQHMPFEECVDDPESRSMRPGFRDSRPNFECVWKRQNATGNVTILVTGNSIAQIATNILKWIIEKENFTQVAMMRLVSMPACYPLEVYYYTCTGFMNSLPQLVQAMKPDLTFVIFDELHINATRMNAPIVNVATDTATADFAAFLHPIVSASRFVVYDELYPRPSLMLTTGMGVAMQKRLSRNQSLDDLRAPLEEFKKYYAPYFARLDQLHFPNLIRHNTSAPLCAEEKGMCWWYNRRNLHSYFTDFSHLTVDGQELMRESYTKILNNSPRRKVEFHRARKINELHIIGSILVRERNSVIRIGIRRHVQ
ncbi:hypothetical protein PRIPAC_73380, partial [Pristionchus pacificus]|uniref:Acyltransferase n=1 Tax=Pristionchus pacificus TaxID=54126 RepID=A0A2A6B4Q6_PRIPA